MSDELDSRLDDVLDAVEQLREALTKLNEDRVLQVERARVIREDVDRLMMLVTEGDGNALITRMLLMEQGFERMERTLAAFDREVKMLLLPARTHHKSSGKGGSEPSEIVRLEEIRYSKLKAIGPLVMSALSLAGMLINWLIKK